MPYCCVRVTKIKDSTHLGNAAAEIGRTKEVKNADPERKRLNDQMVRCADIHEAWREHVGKQTVRKDAVLGLQVTLIRSHEWQPIGTQEEQWIKESQRWLETEFGRENVLLSVIHRDETTPHLQAIVCPLTPTGKLNAKWYTGGRAKMAAMQTSYAKVMAPLGLQRGEEGSLAEHGDIKAHYRKIREAKKAEQAPPKKNIFGIVPSDEVERVHAQVLAFAAAAKMAEAEAKTERQRARKAEKRLLQIQAELENAKAETAKLRATPLVDILEKLGAERDKEDLLKWKLPSTVTVLIEPNSGPKFQCVSDGKVGRGAIDLVIKSLEVDYKGAIAWLADEFGQDVVERDYRLNAPQPANEIAQIIENTPVPSTTPKPHKGAWQRVRAWLVKVWCLAEELVDKLHKKGVLYADRFYNAVFLHADPKGCFSGWETRGTHEEAHKVKTSSGDKGGFFLEGSKPGLVVVASAVEAISARELTGMSAVSTGGADVAAMATMAAWANWAAIKKDVIYASLAREGAGRKMQDATFEYAKKIGSEIYSLPPCDENLIALDTDWTLALQKRRKQNAELAEQQRQRDLAEEEQRLQIQKDRLEAELAQQRLIQQQTKPVPHQPVLNPAPKTPLPPQHPVPDPIMAQPEPKNTGRSMDR